MRIRSRQQQHRVEISSAVSATAEGTHLTLHIDPKNGHAVRSTDSNLYSLSRYKTNWLEKLRAAKGFPVEPVVQIHEFVSALAEQHRNGLPHKKPLGAGSQSSAEGHRQPAPPESDQSKQDVEQSGVCGGRYQKSVPNDFIKEEQLPNTARNGNPWVSVSSEDSLRDDLSIIKARNISGNSVQDRLRTTSNLQPVDVEEEVVKIESGLQSDRFTQIAGSLEKEGIDPTYSGPESAFYEYIFGISSSYAAGKGSSSQADFIKKHKRKQVKPRLCPKPSDVFEQDIAGSTGDVTETAKPNVTESAGENVSSKLCNQSKDQNFPALISAMGTDAARQTDAAETVTRIVATMRHCNGHQKQDSHFPVREAEDRHCAFEGPYLDENDKIIPNSSMSPSPANKDVAGSGQDWKTNRSQRLSHTVSSKNKGPRTVRSGKLGNAVGQSIVCQKNQMTSAQPPAEVEKQTLQKAVEVSGSMRKPNGLGSKKSKADSNPITSGAPNLSERSDIACRLGASPVPKLPIDHPARQSKETLVFSVYQVFAQAGKAGLTAREAVSRILEGGLPGLHEGGVIPRVEVGKILRTSPYFMELEESKYVLCSAVVGAEDHSFSLEFNAVEEDNELAAEGNPEETKRYKQRGSSQLAALAAIRRARTGTTRRKAALDDFTSDSFTVQESMTDECKSVMPQKKRLKSVKQDSSRLGNRCNRSDGKGWHCPLYAQVGYLLCDHHLEKLRLKSASRSRNAQ
ncbi:hypothetical protein O6H91_01G163200 [Diphasiastrum complanatum]|uniref:Uncharacterized protein n=1 Tax=Diphasiastrum complanatum TaxID=34168 RepID=A0ACC2EY69_DIPCM|nr:hypothetical protein O6H91_01G163200 [Diphasiastrum complanatum]